MKKFGEKLLIFVIGNLIVEGICAAITNVMDGKDIFGKELNPDKKTADTKDTFHLETDEYSIE